MLFRNIMWNKGWERETNVYVRVIYESVSPCVSLYPFPCHFPNIVKRSLHLEHFTTL